ncbi:MAG: hypothetical protein ABJN69_11430 [Hellea sp.]
MDFSQALTGAHIISGTIAVLAGAIALGARKGAPFHVNAGRIFAITMIISSGLGAGLGLLKLESHYITFHAGILGITLIASSWLTIRARTSQLSFPSIGIGAINFANAAALIAAGIYAASLPESVLLGFHAGNYFFLSGMAGIAAIGDISLLFRKTLTRKHRLARHLWRMCLGFFIAAGSAFTGPGASIFPQSVQDSGILSAPELIIISLMLFWLVRTLYGKPTLPPPK